MNVAPAGFTLDGGIAKGFTEFFLPLHKRFTPEAHADDLAHRAADLVRRSAQSNDRAGR
jgi:hypothetical protein